MSITHILSVDVEDYFQVEAFASSVPRQSWDQWPHRVADNTLRILDLFDRYGAKATFFFLGWVAERYPALVREAQERGHELGCHSYWHRPVYSLTPEEFRADTRAARSIVEQAGGAPVLGYRAPSWSITKECLWALDILSEEGFLYSSSIYPIRHDLYGIPNANRFAHTHSCVHGSPLREFPPTTVRFLGINCPAAGGGYLRILPLPYTQWVFRRFEREERRPVVTYLHPWEIDPQQPRVAAGLRSRLRHYSGLKGMEQKLVSLLRQYKFQSFLDLLASESEEIPAAPSAHTPAPAGASAFR